MKPEKKKRAVPRSEAQDPDDGHSPVGGQESEDTGDGPDTRLFKFCLTFNKGGKWFIFWMIFRPATLFYCPISGKAHRVAGHQN